MRGPGWDRTDHKIRHVGIKNPTVGFSVGFCVLSGFEALGEDAFEALERDLALELKFGPPEASKRENKALCGRLQPAAHCPIW